MNLRADSNKFTGNEMKLILEFYVALVIEASWDLSAPKIDFKKS